MGLVNVILTWLDPRKVEHQIVMLSSTKPANGYIGSKANAVMLLSGRSVLFAVKNSFLRHPKNEGMKQV